MKKYDAIIIGFGKAGKTLAASLAKENQTVAIIEKDEMMYGGTCINVGCIPSKSLIHSANTNYVKDDDFKMKALKYKEAIIKKRALTSKLRAKNYAKLNDLANVDVINGTASFVDEYTIKVVNNHESLELKADKIFINTGSTPFIPNIEGLKDNPFIHTSSTLMDLEDLPKELVIIGAGYIGLEFASMYAKYGSKVTVIGDSDIFLPREDEDLALEIKKNLKEDGIDFKLGVNVKKVNHNDTKATLFYSKNNEEYQIEADAILVATGRRANIDDLALENANITKDARGNILTNEYLQTNIPHIFAMGDVKGGLQFTYVSLDDYRIVNNFLHKQEYSANQRVNVPNSVFLSPTFSRVGLNEKEAKEKGLNYRVVKLAVSAIPKALVLENPRGLLKALIDNDTNEILGAMIYAEDSHEVINIIKLAMDLKAPYTVLKNQIFTHPTMAESLNDLFSL